MQKIDLRFARKVAAMVARKNGAATPRISLRVMPDDGTAGIGRVYLSPRIRGYSKTEIAALVAHETGHAIRPWQHRAIPWGTIAVGLPLTVVLQGHWLAVALMFQVVKFVISRVVIPMREHDANAIAAGAGLRPSVLRMLARGYKRDFWRDSVFGYPSPAASMRKLSPPRPPHRAPLAARSPRSSRGGA